MDFQPFRPCRPANIVPGTAMSLARHVGLRRSCRPIVLPQTIAANFRISPASDKFKNLFP